MCKELDPIAPQLGVLQVAKSRLSKLPHTLQKNILSFTLFYRTYTIEVMKQCLNCQKEISDKKTYCSDKCRMSYTRRTKKGEQPEQNDPILQPEQGRTGLTRTDVLFSEDAGKRMGQNYYNFDKKVFGRECIALGCGREFKTHLKLLNFCSPNCMRETLNKLTV